MNKKRFRQTIAFAVLGASLLSGTTYAGCGKVTIANMNWASGQLIASLDQFILSHGYGCQALLVPGDTVPTFTSMESKQTPDVAPELWYSNIPAAKEAIKKGRLVALGDGPFSGAGDGWYTTSYTLKKHPNLKTVMDFIQHPQYFPYNEDPSKGAFVTCPAGWGCQIQNKNLFSALKMKAKGWKLVNPGSAAGLDGSIAKAVQSKKAWFGYYWVPTALVNKYNLKKLDFGIAYAGDDNWKNCISTAEQSNQCQNALPSSFPASEIYTTITAKFNTAAHQGPIEYLAKRKISTAVANKMLVYMENEQATGNDAAIHFLKTNEALWSKWVSHTALEKIQHALKKIR